MKRVVTVLALSALLLIACERKKISEINKDPAQYRNKDVAIAGKVVTSFGLLGKGVYEVDDGSGRIWVLAGKNGVPSADAMVGVKGHVTQGVTVMGRTYATIFHESERRTR